MRDYSQDLDSLILSKPSGLRVEQLAMWQDHIGRALARHGPSGEDAGLGCHGDVEEAEERLTPNNKMFQSFVVSNMLKPNPLIS